jgi:hypothetical protein
LSVVAYLIKPLNANELRELARTAVGDYRTYLSVTACRQRLQDWERDLERIETVLRSHASGAASEAVRALLAVNLRNLLVSLWDLKQLTDFLCDHSAQPKRGEGFCPLVMVEAVRDAINVLAKTKSVFKSKELADLRRKLEALVDRH